MVGIGMRPGGSEGGTGSFVLGGGLVLFGLGLYFLLDSVRVVSGQFGVISGAMHRGGDRGNDRDGHSFCSVPDRCGGLVFRCAQEVLLGVAGPRASLHRDRTSESCSFSHGDESHPPLVDSFNDRGWGRAHGARLPLSQISNGTHD